MELEVDWFSVEGEETFDMQFQVVESESWQSDLGNYTNWEENQFFILPELEDEQVDKIQTGWEIVYDYHVMGPVGCSTCIKEFSTFSAFFWWIIISSLIYFVILMIYYIVFKVKKIQNPLKCAFKRSRLWWIMILILPLIVVVVLIYVK